MEETVSVQPLVQMRELWTVDDVEALDVQDWWRYEIVDGALVVSPSTGGDHELAAEETRAAVRAALSTDQIVIGPMGVKIGRSYLVPDLVVTRRAGLRGAKLLHPADVMLAVEIVSPGSATMDRITKPAQYAAAGIPAHWRVETDPVSLTAYTLPEGASVYAELGTWRRGETAHVEAPFPVQIEIDRLMATD